MDCKTARPFLTPYIDDELDATHVVEVEMHLKDCAECAAEVSRNRTLRSALRNPSLRYAAPKLRMPIPRRAWFPWVTSIAFVAAIVAFVMVMPTLPEELAENHTRALMSGHLTDVVSSDRHTVKPWFAGKIDFSPPVVDHADAGFPLAGGRIDRFWRHPVAVLIYRHNAHIVSEYMRPCECEAQPQVLRISKSVGAGYHIVAWASHNMQRWAISDADESTLLEFAKLKE